MTRLLEVAQRGRLDFERSQIGDRAEALWEQRRDGRWLGTTDNYLRVISSPVNGSEPPRDLRPVRLTDLAAGGLVALPLADSVAATV